MSLPPLENAWLLLSYGEKLIGQNIVYVKSSKVIHPRRTHTDTPLVLTTMPRPHWYDLSS